MSNASAVAMGGSLAAGYGTFFAYAGRYLYPARPAPRAWLFVAELARMPVGKAIEYKTPAGLPVTIARRGEAGTSDDFVALSSICPHLGCQVHWQGPKNRFFCPCHNGVFSPEGEPTDGPPAEARQRLAEFPLKVENGLLFIEVELPTAT